MDPESQSPFDELQELYKKESDRGAALLGAAYADAALELALRRWIVQETAVDELFDESHGPLGTFSAKIRMAFALGMLPDVACRDLDLVRSIRNDFAHHPGDVTFDTPSIQQRCDATITGTHVRTLEREASQRQGKAVQRDSHWTPRNLYLNAVALPVVALFLKMEGRPHPETPKWELSIPIK